MISLSDYARACINRMVIDDDKWKIVTIIDPSYAKEIFSATGLELTNHELIIHPDWIRHAFEEHGDVRKEMQRGQIAIGFEDFDLLPKIVTEAKSFRLANRSNRSFITFVAHFEVTYLACFELHIGNKKRLPFRTLYKQKAGKGRL